jgi:hypothetical protein
MEGDMIWFILGCLIVHYVVLMLVIAAATTNKHKDKYMLAPTELLLKIVR